MIARLGGVTLSVLLHAGLIALLLAWSAVDWTGPLFVDLVEPAEAPGSPAAGPSPAPSARPAARAARPPRPASSRAASRPAPPAPAAPAAPAPAPAPAASPWLRRLAAGSRPRGRAAGRATVRDADAPRVVRARRAGRRPRRGLRQRPGRVRRGRRPDARRCRSQGPEAGPARPSRLATPGSGGSGAAPAEYGPYLRQFRQRVQESLVYPLAARRQGLGGTVELHVWLEATGRVRDVQVARSSSHGVLDAAALETIRRLGPVPFPESLPRRPLLIRIPLVYELR